MTEAAADSVRQENSDYAQAWADSLSQVLGQIGGSAVSCRLMPETPAELAAPNEKDVWMIVACSGGLRGEMALRVDPASALRAAQMFMSEPATPGAELTPEHREAVAELLRQVAGLVVTAIKGRWGEVTLRLDFMPGLPSWPASSTFWLRAGADDAAVFIELQLSAALVAALRAATTETTAPVTPEATPAPSPGAEDGAKLALLMDVELSLTLRFGGRNLLLRDVLELSPGAVVELDRQVQDPVDVLLDGRMVARGEVVVLGGNYGLRVTEVLASGAI